MVSHIMCHHHVRKYTVPQESTGQIWPVMIFLLLERQWEYLNFSDTHMISHHMVLAVYAVCIPSISAFFMAKPSHFQTCT